MEINKTTIERIIMFLYLTEEWEACDALLQVYKGRFVKDQ